MGIFSSIEKTIAESFRCLFQVDRHHKQPAYGSGAQPPEVGKKLVAEILTIPGVTGIPVRYDDVTESDGKK